MTHARRHIALYVVTAALGALVAHATPPASTPYRGTQQLATIDPAKIEPFTVSQSEFVCLDGVTSAIEPRLSEICTTDQVVIGGTTNECGVPTRTAIATPLAAGGTAISGTTVTATTQFSGPGAGLTSIPGGQLDAGSVTNAKLANSSLSIAVSAGLNSSGCSPVSLGGTCTISQNLAGLVDTQTFVGTSGTWTKPSGGQTTCSIRLCAAGGGGGSGRRAAAAASGGGGGAPGGCMHIDVPMADLASTEAITGGAGGTGGLAQNANDTNGNVGGVGANAQFGSKYRCLGGNGGAGGTTTTATGGTASNCMFGSPNNGATGQLGTGSGTASTGWGGGPGGGGGGWNGVSAANGGPGGVPAGTALNFATGGTAPSGAGTAGGSVNTTTPGVGGGGGAGSAGVAAAGVGGAGGGAAAGGGGGGGSNNGQNSGAGGNGAPTFVQVICR